MLKNMYEIKTTDNDDIKGSCENCGNKKCKEKNKNFVLYCANWKEKKYIGYGYHGGGRPRKDTEARRVTISISGTQSEIDELKKRAADAGLNVSRFVLDNLTK